MDPVKPSDANTKFIYQRIFTDSDIFDRRILRRATEDIESIEDVINDSGDLVPKNRHLVIDLRYVPDAKDGLQTHYYFVDHDSRTIFFLDTFQAESMTAWWEAPGCNSMKHLGNLPFCVNRLNNLTSSSGIEMEAQYWYAQIPFR